MKNSGPYCLIPRSSFVPSIGISARDRDELINGCVQVCVERSGLFVRSRAKLLSKSKIARKLVRLFSHPKYVPPRLRSCASSDRAEAESSK